MRGEIDLFEGEEVAWELGHVVIVAGVAGWVLGIGDGGGGVGRGGIVGARELGGWGGGGWAAEFFEEVGEAGGVHVDVGCGGVFGLGEL